MAPIGPLTWELPYGAGVALKRKKKKKERERERTFSKPAAQHSRALGGCLGLCIVPAPNQ